MPSIPALFARHGLRCTQQREGIYRALASTTSHPTAEELFVIVKRRQPGMSLGTVYNALEAFTRKGLARRFAPVAGDLGPARYDADTSEHAHFMGDDGRVRDVPMDVNTRVLAALPREVLDEIERRMGVQVSRVTIQIEGRSTGSGGAC